MKPNIVTSQQQFQIAQPNLHRIIELRLFKAWQALPPMALPGWLHRLRHAALSAAGGVVIVIVVLRLPAGDPVEHNAQDVSPNPVEPIGSLPGCAPAGATCLDDQNSAVDALREDNSIGHRQDRRAVNLARPGRSRRPEVPLRGRAGVFPPVG